jgi:hypothetical protein
MDFYDDEFFLASDVPRSIACGVWSLSQLIIERVDLVVLKTLFMQYLYLFCNNGILYSLILLLYVKT